MANIATLTPTTVDCARLCASSPGCTAANYLAATKTCQIFKKTCFLTEDAVGWSFLDVSQPLVTRTFQYISSQTLTWYNAKNYCESIGGGLANVLTTDDLNRILSILSQFGNPPQVWLGGSDEVTEGDWIWLNGCRFKDQTLSIWKPGEPNNSGNNEHCLGLTASKWNDAPCTALLTFVCEIYVA